MRIVTGKPDGIARSVDGLTTGVPWRLAASRSSIDRALVWFCRLVPA